VEYFCEYILNMSAVTSVVRYRDELQDLSCGAAAKYTPDSDTCGASQSSLMLKPSFAVPACRSGAVDMTVQEKFSHLLQSMGTQ